MAQQQVICDPYAKPKMTRSKVAKHSESLVIGQSTYKLTHTSKLSVTVGRAHSSKLGRVSRWLPKFPQSAGFILQKFNDVGASETVSDRSIVMGACSNSSGNASSQLIALTHDMAAALFSVDYVKPLETFLKEEMMTAVQNSGEGDEVTEMIAHKEALKIPAPAHASRSRHPIGSLVVGTTFSNFNVVRHMFSEEDCRFEGEDGTPQLLSQIVMVDSRANPESAPMIRFSAPATDIIAILKHEPFREMVAFFRPVPDSQQSVFTPVSRQTSQQTTDGKRSGGDSTSDEPKRRRPPTSAEVVESTDSEAEEDVRRRPDTPRPRRD